MQEMRSFAAGLGWIRRRWSISGVECSLQAYRSFNFAFVDRRALNRHIDSSEQYKLLQITQWPLSTGVCALSAAVVSTCTCSGFSPNMHVLFDCKTEPYIDKIQDQLLWNHYKIDEFTVPVGIRLLGSLLR